MPENISLEELVLGYCRQVGGLVEPPAYGIYETLLPDEVAARWGVAAHQRFTFSAEAETESTFLHYGHALVETIVNELRLQTANGRFFINNVRLEKPGLYAIIEKAISISNAKLFPVTTNAPLPGAVEQRGAFVVARLHHYVRFNFKVSLISDEKRELILPVWMDVQGGYAIRGDEIEGRAILDMEGQFQQLEPAAPFWMDGKPLAPKVFAALLERARKSVADELGDTLAGLQKRLRRFLELDRARLNEYYADLLKDVERRLQKADVSTAIERRPALEAKRAAIIAERQSKLEDVEQKYHLRIQLELLNVAVIAQPKLDLTVEIRKRAVTVKRVATWDPLLHVVEPLACDVCARPGKSLSLCENGHLAHNDCLAPQCVECKRTYCQKCADQVQSCAVCDRPVCVHSLKRCITCQRVTCNEHLDECHADNGQPRRARSEEKPVFPTGADMTETSPGAKTSSPKTEQPVTTNAPPRQKTAAKREAPKGQTSHPGRPQGSPLLAPLKEKLADHMEVYADPAQGSITAYAMLKKREVATRVWELTNEGISVMCWCEKGPLCREKGIVYRPAEPEFIESQIKRLLKSFQQEYDVPDTKIRYHQIRQNETYAELKLKVPSRWKEPAALEQARAGFEKLRSRR
ncbi:MAG: hypothetical protein QMD04_00155 [Anaerolineales bacterium]|nr:hypothetical protein [Anaerolineales bacterium]